MGGQNTIVEGHGRLEACKQLGIKNVPVIRLDHLSDEERKAYGLIHNSTTLNSGFDEKILKVEIDQIQKIDLSSFGLLEVKPVDWFESRKRDDNEGLENESEEYQEFIEKFEAKRTTDDCYTPDAIHECVIEWVEKEYDVSREKFVRPFYPGGDYENFEYEPGAIVVDNPPFSIESQIIDFYTKRGIKFFMYGPAMTLLSNTKARSVSVIAVGAQITYENGAVVPTSFVTNLEDEDVAIRSCGSLRAALDEADKVLRQQVKKQLDKYNFPENVVTSAMLTKLSKWGVDYFVKRSEAKFITSLESMKKEGKEIYGGGYLVSDDLKIAKAKAEEIAKAKAEEEKSKVKCWVLSANELDVIRSLGENHEK